MWEGLGEFYTMDWFDDNDNQWFGDEDGQWFSIEIIYILFTTNTKSKDYYFITKNKDYYFTTKDRV